ncbi:MAG TPA: PIG-L family deacetylase [Longimicrobium sp.]|uniref:PIG-L deacetylase family protein n=1 Tax=Longimicrobium sp. TaxID=2029185 RepID=UPI002EDAB2EE
MPVIAPRVASEYVVQPRHETDPAYAALIRCFQQPAGTVAVPRVLLLAAHPDDESIGAGGMLPRLAESVQVVHVTDGAPRHRRQWGRNEFADWDGYAGQRRREVLRALEVAGVPAESCRALGVMDNEVSHNLVALTHRLRELVEELRPDVILTHPYEGGHTDHDAVAFCTRAARTLLARAGGPAPAIAEFTSYHNLGGEKVVNRFLPFDGAPETEIVLTAEEKARKRRMYDCFPSQGNALRDMPIRVERFRPAPRYDFTAAPHAGRLRYERYPLGIRGAQWRRMAAEALAALGLPRDADPPRAPLVPRM